MGNAFGRPLHRLRQSGFSAVGSALRSGRRGRWFESSNPDPLQRSQMVAITIWLFSFYPLPHSPRIPVIIGTMPNRLATPLIYKMVERVGPNLLIDYAFPLWLRNSIEDTVKPKSYWNDTASRIPTSPKATGRLQHREYRQAQKLLATNSNGNADKPESYWQTIVPGAQLTAPRQIFYSPTLCHFVRKAYFCSK